MSLFFLSWQKAYVFTFLLSARLFIPPPELLARVCELCIKQQQLDQSPLDTVSNAPHTLITRTRVNTLHTYPHRHTPVPPVQNSGSQTAEYSQYCFCISVKVKKPPDCGNKICFTSSHNRQKCENLVPRSCSCWRSGLRHFLLTLEKRRWSDTSRTSSAG